MGDVRVGVSGDPRPAAATVLACLLGIRIAVAVAWQRACSGDLGASAAEVSRRPRGHDSDAFRADPSLPT